MDESTQDLARLPALGRERGVLLEDLAEVGDAYAVGARVV